LCTKKQGQISFPAKLERTVLNAKSRAIQSMWPNSRCLFHTTVSKTMLRFKLEMKHFKMSTILKSGKDATFQRKDAIDETPRCNMASLVPPVRQFVVDWQKNYFVITSASTSSYCRAMTSGCQRSARVSRLFLCRIFKIFLILKKNCTKSKNAASYG